jgi:hypothetical protein
MRLKVDLNTPIPLSTVFGGSQHDRIGSGMTKSSSEMEYRDENV